MRRKVVYLVVSGAILAALLFAGISWAAARVDNLQPGFPEAPADELAAQGIQLSAPGPFDRPSIQQAEAERTAQSLYGGAKASVRHSMLVRTHVGSGNLDCLCWAVSLVPPGGKLVPSRPARSGASLETPWASKYVIVFINASTGRLQFALERGERQ